MALSDDRLQRKTGPPLAVIRHYHAHTSHSRQTLFVSSEPQHQQHTPYPTVVSRETTGQTADIPGTQTTADVLTRHT